MATYEFTAAPTNATDETFRAWGSELSAALSAVGMVQTDDTGQIDWQTVSTPAPTNNAAAGYEVWRFDDTLQSTHPVFFKIEYGSSDGGGSTMGQRVRLWLTVGKGSDGAGEITGVLLDRTAVGARNAGSNTSGVSSDLLGGVASTCAEGACLTLFPFIGMSSGGILPAFIIERSRSNLGSPTGDGLLVVTQTGSGPGPNTGTVRTQFAAINYAAASSNIGAVPVVLPYTIAGVDVSDSSSLSAGAIGPVIPWQAYAPGIAPWQPRAGVSFLEGDLIPGVTTIRLAGRDAPYRAIPVDVGHCGWGVIPQPAYASFRYRVGVAILWEDE